MKYSSKLIYVSGLALYTILVVFLCQMRFQHLQNYSWHHYDFDKASVEKIVNSIERSSRESKKSAFLKADENPLIQNRNSQSGGKLPIILVWTTSPWIEKKGIEFIAKKEMGYCRVTMDRSTVKDSIGIVLFNNHLKLDPLDIPDPKERNSRQTYVFWTTETPAKTFHFKNLLENPLFDPIFNLSMSLMPTADIQLAFGSYRRALEFSKQHKFSTDKSSPLWKKKKLAVWVVSNCHRLPGAIERVVYAKNLVKAGLKLDKFGKCFKGSRDHKNLQKFVKDYKFYLAFENSVHCPDYITEKFWRNSLQAGLVPIVFGPTKQDVMKVAPPKSYIHVDDFKTPRDLVKFLQYLDRNSTAYMEYHKWRDNPISTPPRDNISNGLEEVMSNLCKRLVKERHPPKMIPSISKLLYERGYPDNKCLRPFSNMSEKEQNENLDF